MATITRSSDELMTSDFRPAHFVDFTAAACSTQVIAANPFFQGAHYITTTELALLRIPGLLPLIRVTDAYLAGSVNLNSVLGPIRSWFTDVSCLSYWLH